MTVKLDYIILKTSGKKPINFLISIQDYKRVSRYKWYVNHTGYIYNASVPFVMLQRFILKPPPNFLTDHINRNPLDNRRENLRLATPLQNRLNSPGKRNSTSKYKGVWKYKYVYGAKITINGRHHHLGTFKTELEAVKEYNKFALKYHGDFAYLNNINENGN